MTDTKAKTYQTLTIRQAWAPGDATEYLFSLTRTPGQAGSAFLVWHNCPGHRDKGSRHRQACARAFVIPDLAWRYIEADWEYVGEAMAINEYDARHVCKWLTIQLTTITNQQPTEESS